MQTENDSQKETYSTMTPAERETFRVRLDARLAARDPGPENLGEIYKFKPGAPCFLNGKYHGISRDIPLAWELVGRRVEMLINWHPLAYRLEYIRECVDSGALLMPVFIKEDSKYSPDVGLIDVGRSEEGDVICAIIHNFEPIDLTDLSRLCEILALSADAAGVSIWSLTECPVVPGYQEISCQIGRWQAMSVKPIH